mgnify:CR=1 FL=1
MNEIVYCYNVKLYIKHNIEMMHIIVNKNMNKINKHNPSKILNINVILNCRSIEKKCGYVLDLP